MASFDSLPPPIPLALRVLLRRICLAPLGCPLLANIYLNPLDHLMSRNRHEMVRYADDMVILCPSAEAAGHVLQTLREWANLAGLEQHPGKIKVVDMEQTQARFDFLGYRFW